MTDYTIGAAGSRHVGDLLSDYVNGDLPVAERREVESHLRECAHCSADLRTLRLTVQAVRRLPLEPIPRSFAISSAARPSTPVTSFLRWSTTVLAAALVLFLAVGVVLPAVAPEYAGRSRPFVAPASAPVQAPASQGQTSSVGPSIDINNRAATAQAIGRATVTAMERSAAAAAATATPAPAAPAAPAPPQAAADAASGAPAAPPGAVAASAPAAAPALSAAAPPANTPVKTTAQSAGPTSGSPSDQAPRPVAAGAANSQGAVETPTTNSYPGSTQPLAVPTPLPEGTYPSSTQPLVIPTPLPEGTYPTESVISNGVAPLASYPSPAPAVTPARPAATAPTTWFTPALGLLILIAVVSAIAMSWFGRRGR